MAINNPYLPIKVITNGVLDTFAFNWSLTQAQDIKVYFEDSRGVKTLVDTGDYTLQRNTGENGGNIIFNTPPTTGQTLIIEREDEKTQEKEFSNTKTFNLKYFQDALDKLTRWCQEQDYGIGQAIKIPETAISDEEDPIDIWNRIILSDTGESIKYAKIESGNLYVKALTGSWIMMPKSSNIRQVRQRVEYIDTSPIYIFEYSLNGTDWFDIGDCSLYKQHKFLNGRDEPNQHPAESVDFDNGDDTTTNLQTKIENIDTEISDHISDTDNPHAVTAEQIGLGNVDNTSDADKPISDDTQGALDLKADDNAVVHLTGNETIADIKTFSSFPVTPSSAPTTDYQVANKKYVDDNAGGGGNTNNLLDFKWADHELNDQSWFNANTFAWADGTVYVNAYNHLVDDINGKTLNTETIAGITISYYLADDGHKICPESEGADVLALYEATGIAWYYLLDETNTRFKLPRAKHKYWKNTTTLPVFTGETIHPATGAPLSWTDQAAGSASLIVGGSNNDGDGFKLSTSGTMELHNFNFTGSSSYKATIVPGNLYADPTAAIDETGFYLYFYVGQFTQTALENTAGLNAELFNGKADLNLMNTASNVDFVIETYVSGSNWYRKYKSGWVEQGQTYHQAGAVTYSRTFLIPFVSVPTLKVSSHMNSTSNIEYRSFGYSITTTEFSAYTGTSTNYISWIAYGYAA